MILVYYAEISSFDEYISYEITIDKGDVNGSGKIDAVDASLILMYYAHLSTGGTQTFDAFLENNI